MPPFAQARTRLVLIGVALILLVGCATGRAPSAPPTGAASIAASSRPALPAPTGSPVATARPTPVQSELVVAALPQGGQTVFPGRYTPQFRPALLMTIDRQVNIDCAPGYRCRGDVDVNIPGWLGLEFGHDHPIEIMLMGFDQVYDPRHSGKEIDPPADLAAWISAFPGVTVLGQQSVEIGGIAGTQLDMRTTRDVPFGPTGLADLPSLGFGAHQLHRVFVVRVDEAAVVIGLGSINPADATQERLAAAADVLQPIVDSITWQ